MTSNTGPITSLTTQQTAVLLSALTYSTDPQSDISSYLPNWTIVWDGNETDDGNYAFIALDPSSTIYALAIRGSLPPFDVFDNWDAFANWVLEDLDVVTRVNWTYVSNTTSNAEISQGAYTAFTNLQKMTDKLGSKLSIYDYLKTNAVAPGSKQVIITGHSLGGNAANVYASYFVTALAAEPEHYSFNNSTSLVTFAAPAVGNSGFASDLDNKILNAWHYENAQDIVPKFPPYLTVLLVALMYQPAPSAGQISVTYKGVTVTLRDALMILAGILAVYDYQQQTRNYTVFDVAVDGTYSENTIEGFFDQAGVQHQVVNYANNLNVKLPQTLVAQSKLV